MIIIITGEIGSGKTTVCQKLLRLAQSRGLSCGGFITAKASDGSINIEDVKTGKHRILASTEAKYHGHCTGKYYFNPIAIEFGARAIDNSNSDDVLFMDEIGWLELRGEGFSMAIEAVNARKDKHSILVIRKELLPSFLPKLSQKPLIFEVSTDNRNDLPEQILAHLIKAKINIFISAIILAAGEGKRLGGDKLLLPMNDSTIIERTVDNFLASKVEEVIVVTGYKAQEMKKAIGKRQVRIAFNRAYKQGLSTSIVRGLNAIDKRATCVIFTLGDLPFLAPPIINKVVDVYMTGGKGIVLPVYRGNWGHPVVFDIKYKGELLKLKGDVGARELLGKYSDDLLEVEVDSDSILSDIDTIERYREVVIPRSSTPD